MNNVLTKIRRLFAGIRVFGAQLFNRRNMRMPMIVRNRNHIGFQEIPNGHAATVDPEIVGNEEEDMITQALNDYLAPQHGKDQYTDFTEIGPDGTVRHNSENWQRRNNAMTGTFRTARLVVSSGLAVPHDQVGARCQNPKCGKYEARIFFRPCSRCGRVFCSGCILSLTTPDGVLLLCPDDYKREVAAYDCWSAVDINEGKKLGIPVMPERPFAGIDPRPTRR